MRIFRNRAACVNKLRAARNPGNYWELKEDHHPVATAPQMHSSKQILPVFFSAKINFFWSICNLCYEISVVTIYGHLWTYLRITKMEWIFIEERYRHISSLCIDLEGMEAVLRFVCLVDDVQSCQVFWLHKKAQIQIQRMWSLIVFVKPLQEKNVSIFDDFFFFFLTPWIYVKLALIFLFSFKVHNLSINPKYHK